MTPAQEEHRADHVRLHDALDELLADYQLHTDRLLGKATIMELMQWSYQQTLDPTVPADDMED